MLHDARHTAQPTWRQPRCSRLGGLLVSSFIQLVGPHRHPPSNSTPASVHTSAYVSEPASRRTLCCPPRSAHLTALAIWRPPGDAGHTAPATRRKRCLLPYGPASRRLLSVPVTRRPQHGAPGLVSRLSASFDAGLAEHFSALVSGALLDARHADRNVRMRDTSWIQQREIIVSHIFCYRGLVWISTLAI